MQRHKDHVGINKAHFEELMTMMLMYTEADVDADV